MHMTRKKSCLVCNACQIVLRIEDTMSQPVKEKKCRSGNG